MTEVTRTPTEIITWIDNGRAQNGDLTKTYLTGYMDPVVSGKKIWHGINDLPAYVRLWPNAYRVEMIWYKHNQRHRTTGPATVQLFNNNIDLEQFWLEHVPTSRMEFERHYMFTHMREYVHETDYEKYFKNLLTPDAV